MTRNFTWYGALRPALLVLGITLLTGCRTSAAKDARPLGTELTASQLERQIRTLDSIETVLRKGPGGAARADSAAYASSVSDRYPLRPVMEPLALPDSASARNVASLGTTVRSSALRASPVQMVSVPAFLAPAPLAIPAEVLAPLWALAPLAGATSVARATVTTATTVAVVPEPGTMGMLASGLGLLAVVSSVRRKRRDDPERDARTS